MKAESAKAASLARASGCGLLTRLAQMALTPRTRPRRVPASVVIDVADHPAVDVPAACSGGPCGCTDRC